MAKYPHKEENRRQRLGYSKHPVYRAFKHMKDRCYNINSESYKWYGARGITVCDEWLNNTNSFIEWADRNGYKKGLQIDRMDNNGNYEPSNCRFVTPKINSRNTRKNITAEYNGQTKLFIEWCEVFGLHYDNVYLMLIHKQNLSPTEAIQQTMLCQNPKYFRSEEAFNKAQSIAPIRMGTF